MRLDCSSCTEFLTEFKRLPSVVRELLELNSVRAMNLACAFCSCLGLRSFFYGDTRDDATGIFLSVIIMKLLLVVFMAMLFYLFTELCLSLGFSTELALLTSCRKLGLATFAAVLAPAIISAFGLITSQSRLV